MKLCESGTPFLTQPDREQIKTLGKLAGVESIHIYYDPKTDLKAILVIHNTNLGPALGGCRCVEYTSVIDGALDAIRLAVGMTHKSAVVNLPFGGGKAVLLKPKVIKNREEYFKAFGRFVDRVNREGEGSYITCVDSGTTTIDADIMATQTSFVTGCSRFGDPSEYTTRGVLDGIKAAVKFKLHRDDLRGVRFSIQGVGKVGKLLIDTLLKEGALVTACDDRYRANPEYRDLVAAYEAAGVCIVADADIYTQPADVFAPCALGAIINDDTIPQLVQAGVQIIAGAANNQLKDTHRHGKALLDHHILYAPDYVINGGGLIYVVGQAENSCHNIEIFMNKIGPMLTDIFLESQRLGISTSICADRIAEERFNKAKNYERNC